ncbi:MULTISPECIES: peptide MFS transporter [Capnocytophaga]|uniref:Proton-dependent oligopeptide transporter, POT family n=1 Tax=Capnocytophaga granulosa TaxID=45242 RepID=A0A1H2UZZ1_9FLAO|nr:MULTISPECIES: peptide MFS transporter [Capnocytophaga]EJU32381.1 transporter, major facilitator family protein [Capnocytophaga sp. CM59]EPD28238.1 amino acid/peptide transporter (Peptide:H+ symporter) [Capnocytophaga granulosa ATCC 51502]SDW61666.1 proton-dependent oligopeptide transporter, POT family [Capnocytophaga granulosa]SUX18173.1 Probable dipeptide and tripeptide permease YjdL [Capnocytophaga granulosa]
MNDKKTHYFDTKVLGQPSGLFFLFFTEMWERFSFYGMRVLLVQFLTAEILLGDPKGGWGWTSEQATALYGTYAMLLYLTPVLGGIIADKYLGTRRAVIIGSIIMTIGQLCLFLHSTTMFFVGLTCLVVGVGLFKPNVPSILGEMFKDHPDKKDSAYTIFYMGVNAGAFLGMMLCGYLAATKGWSWGFGLAGIFMGLGTLQFVFAKPLMGDLGMLKKEVHHEQSTDTDKRNPFTLVDNVLIVVVSVLGLLYAFNDPLSKNHIYDLFAWVDTSLMRGQNLVALVALLLFVYLLVSRILRYDRIVRNRMFAVMSLAFFIIFFFITFEQAPSSLIIVARDYVDRSLSGEGLLVFNIINALLMLIPLLIISFVLIRLAMVTWKLIPLTNIVLFVCFLLIWGVAIYAIRSEFLKKTSEIAVSWFSVLNAFFVITLASSVSKIWSSKYNPSVAFKYGFGLFFVALGYLVVWFGAKGLSEDMKISMAYIILIYFFHTIGELFISPVGLSYVSKLVPHRMLAFMFGTWYLGIAIAQKVAATLGGQVVSITKEYGLSTFFLIFAGIAAGAGILVMLYNPVLKKLMHEVK